MLKTKLTSSLEKAFIDDKIDTFPTIDSISVVKSERFSVQLLYVDEGPDYSMPWRSLTDLTLEGDLASYATVRDVRNVPVDRPVNPDRYDEHYLRTAPGIYPDLLTPLRYGGKIVPGRDKLRSLWIEIEPPKELIGKCELVISLSFEEVKVTHTLSVDIMPADLPRGIDFTQWFYAD